MRYARRFKTCQRRVNAQPRRRLRRCASSSALAPSARCLLTAEDLAARWRVPKSHVYRLTREGAVPAVRLGRYYRYKLEAIEAFEGEETVPPEQPSGGVT